MSTHVQVDRDNPYFRISASRSYGRAVGGVDATMGSDWKYAHEKFFSLIDKSFFVVLEQMRRENKLAFEQLIFPVPSPFDASKSYENRFREGLIDCSAKRGDQAICLAVVAVEMSPELIAAIVKKAPVENKTKVKSEDNPLLSDGQSENSSIETVNTGGTLSVSVYFVAKEEPSEVLKKEIQSKVESQLKKDFMK